LRGDIKRTRLDPITTFLEDSRGWEDICLGLLAESGLASLVATSRLSKESAPPWSLVDQGLENTNVRSAGILGSSLSFFLVLLPPKDVTAFRVDGVVVVIACQSACKARDKSFAERSSCLGSAPMFDDAARLPVS
jgi:hypothetical protein